MGGGGFKEGLGGGGVLREDRLGGGGSRCGDLGCWGGEGGHRLPLPSLALPLTIPERSRNPAVMHMTPELEVLGSIPGGGGTQCPRR